MKNKLNTGFWWFIVVGMVVLMIIGAFSCNPAKRFTKTMAKANAKRPAMVLGWYETNYPRTELRDDSSAYLAAIRSMDSIQKRQQLVYDSLAGLLQETDRKLAEQKSDTSCAGKDERIRLLTERSDILSQQLAAAKPAKQKPLPPIIRPVEDSAKIRAALLQAKAADARADSLFRVNAEVRKGVAGTKKTNGILWWVAGAGILGTVIMGFVGSKGGWIVALIKGVVKIIQSFKKK